MEKKIRIILIVATGFVGEGVLFACLPFKKGYNFRPGFIRPTAGQQNVKSYYKFIARLYPLLHCLFPNQVSTMEEVGKAMINSVLIGYAKSVLEISDIKLLAYRSAA